MDATGDSNTLRLVPAHLSLLTIYNPSLGTTDETLQDQITFYYSHNAQKKKRRDLGIEERGIPDEKDLKKEEDEKLRQIGLAQGMVHFAKNFSNGRSLDHIDTEKTRIITREIEPNWWILATINLTKLPIVPTSQSTSKLPADGKTDNSPKFEYSSKEVAPPALLLEQLERAHSTFLLHTGSSLSHLFNRLGRTKFCTLLDRFWTKFAVSWNILLHGSPAVDIFGGMKLAAGGELGMGVGEEEWGSGEREVLEDFVRRTDGLVDMVVSRFGHPPSSNEKDSSIDQIPEPWMGVGRIPQASDGVVFSGMSMISKSSLRDISYWVSSVYSHGEAAFGVRDSPMSDRRKRKRPIRTEKPQSKASVSKAAAPKIGIPPPIIHSAEKSLDQAIAKVEGKQQEKETSKSKTIRSKSPSKTTASETADPTVTQSSSWTKYLTLGYGTAWSLPEFDTLDFFSSDVPSEANVADIPEDALKARLEAHVAQENGGYFLIGLRGDPEDESDEVVAEQRQAEQSPDEAVTEWNRRMMLRTLHVNVSPSVISTLDPSSTSSSIALLSPALSTPGIDSDATSRATQFNTAAQNSQKRRRLRVLVYAHRPFFYVLLFNPSTPSLMMPPFYRHLHTFLSPLRDLLARRTGSVVGGMRRKGSLFGLATTPGAENESSKTTNVEKDVFEVLFDEASLATVSSLPCIPQLLQLPGSSSNEDSTSPYPKRDADCPPGWTRAEALNVHSAALDILASNKVSSSAGLSESSDGTAIERSVKTGRGWWVVWGRLGDNINFGPLSSSSVRYTATTPAATDVPSGVKKPVTPHVRGEPAQDYFSTHKQSSASNAVPNTQMILVRRAQNVDSKGKARATSGLGWNLGPLGGAASEAGKMLDASRFGIGFDARRYMEGIVRLGR